MHSDCAIQLQWIELNYTTEEINATIKIHLFYDMELHD